MSVFTNARKELIASGLVNLAILVLSAGAISDAFIRFRFSMKVFIFAIGFLLFGTGVWICPDKEK